MTNDEIAEARMAVNSLYALAYSLNHGGDPPTNDELRHALVTSLHRIGEAIEVLHREVFR